MLSLFPYHKTKKNRKHKAVNKAENRRKAGPPGSLALARWAGWSAGQVGRHVKC